MTEQFVAAPPTGPLTAAWQDGASLPSLRCNLDGARSRLQSFWKGLLKPGNTGPLRLPTAVIERAHAERGTPWPQPLVSHYARFFRDGNRTSYEGLIGERQRRLTRAVLLALQQPGDQVWLDEVIDGTYLLCEQSSWCWAAHDDVFFRKGHVVPDPSNPYLDLGAGEVVAQLAWIDLLLGARIDTRAPGLRSRIRSETNTRAFVPFLTRLDWHWLGLDGDVHNWNPWIHSNVLTAALLLEDEPGRRAELTLRVIEGLDRFLSSLPSDGAIDEGFAYWWNGAGRALEALELLEVATAGELNGDLPLIRELVAFPHRMHVGGSFFLNVADGPGRASDTLPWELVHRWARRVNDDDATRHARCMIGSEPVVDASLLRALHAVSFDDSTAFGARSTVEDETPVSPPLVPFTYLESVQILVARETGGSASGLVLTAKGGHNAEHHNHLDVGSVTVAVDGVPLLVDAGQPTYTAQTFGPDRYSIRAMQSEWHSVPAPWGLGQGVGREFSAVVVQPPTPQQLVMAMQLEKAYGLPDGAEWRRAAGLQPASGERGAVITVRDEWHLPDASEDNDDGVYVRYLLAGGVTVQRGMATVAPEGIPGVVSGRSALLSWDPAAAEAGVEHWELDDPLLAEVWGGRLTRLTFRTAPGMRRKGSFTLEIKANHVHQ
ncbi:heparinase [Arthrobacter sp. JZ12]|uniref:heparinase II/III family protein n=1 Tax=Arthrobacter sp. JZ12 TaxID=2654190 RepID=UPI002B4A6E42|nr:heparinase II/III family protein [Arthrobacter sp. JZ12]WRH23897.1 heparinase [Arthrobacter sp. JZ12]